MLTLTLKGKAIWEDKWHDLTYVFKVPPGSYFENGLQVAGWNQRDQFVFCNSIVIGQRWWWLDKSDSNWSRSDGILDVFWREKWDDFVMDETGSVTERWIQGVLAWTTERMELPKIEIEKQCDEQILGGKDREVFLTIISLILLLDSQREMLSKQMYKQT